MEIKKFRVVQLASMAVAVLMVVLYFSMKSAIDKMNPAVGLPIVLSMSFIYIAVVGVALGLEIAIRLQKREDGKRIAEALLPVIQKDGETHFL